MKQRNGKRCRRKPSRHTRLLIALLVALAMLAWTAWQMHIEIDFLIRKTTDMQRSLTDLSEAYRLQSEQVTQLQADVQRLQHIATPIVKINGEPISVPKAEPMPNVVGSKLFPGTGGAEVLIVTVGAVLNGLTKLIHAF